MRHKIRHQRHGFHYRLEPSGKVFTHWAKVIIPSRNVSIPLKTEYVRESIHLDGVGNTTKCTMAVCARREAHCFPHHVEGHIDWTYTRAFVVSKLANNGLPAECYVYEHRDGIGRLNDTPGGQQKLLKQLEAEGGERMIVLTVPHKIPSKAGSNKPQGKSDGSRSKKAGQGRGAKLRYAVAQMGAVPS